MPRGNPGLRRRGDVLTSAVYCARLADLVQQREELDARLTALISEAATAGVTVREIGAATGLSHGTVVARVRATT